MTRADVRRWAAPAFAVTAGVVLAAIYLARDDAGSAVLSFIVLAGYGAFLVLGRRSETIGLLGSGQPDERRDEIGRRAALFAGYVVLAAVLAGFVWELAHGRDGQPFSALAAIAGVAFIAGTIWYRRRL